ncbi:MAG: glycoside hydrolase family 13 protein [Pseudomonadota bacterium]
MTSTTTLRALSAIAASCLCLLAGAAQAKDYRIDHLEPPFWWAGMHDKKVQLMVHGAQIADLAPSLDWPGVRIDAVTRVANKNYLFVDLVIEPSAAPGKFEIRFEGGGKRVGYPYELLARVPGSASRKGFNSSDAIYQLMPDRFANGSGANDSVAAMPDKLDRKLGHGRHGGDLQGMIERLGYIADLGFTQLWPTPLVENDMENASYHGYAATDHYRIDARYGSNADYKRLADEGRKKGIGIIQDVVLSHIGLNHWWMKDMPTPDWTNHAGKFVGTQHHRVAVQDPYAAAEDSANFTTGWFGPHMPDMNQTNPLVATYLIQNNIWWIEYAGLSGLRIDTYGYSDGVFLTDYTRRLMAEYPNLNMVGEEWHKSPAVVSRWQRGKRNFDGYVNSLPSLMDFPMTEVMRSTLANKELGEGFNDVYELLSQDYLYSDPGNLVLFEGNHDVPRMFSVVNEDQGMYRIALAYLMTMPRIPQFYYGTEIQMTSTTKGRDDSSYRQDMPGGWAGDKVSAFTGEGLSAQQREAQALVRKLANWRKNKSVIHHGKMMHYGAENGTYVYFRYDGKQKVLVAFNKNGKDVSLPAARFHEMLKGVDGGVDVISGRRFDLRTELKLPARSAVILEL